MQKHPSGRSMHDRVGAADASGAMAIAPPRRSPIHWLILCGVLLIAAIIVGTAVMVGNFRERALSSSERELENTVLLLARHFDQQLGDAEVIQNSLVQYIYTAGIGTPWGLSAPDVRRGRAPDARGPSSARCPMSAASPRKHRLRINGSLTGIPNGASICARYPCNPELGNGEAAFMEERGGRLGGADAGGFMALGSSVRRSPIHWLILCGVLLIAAIIVGTAVMVGNFRERALSSSERELENTVLLLARHFDQQLEDAEVIQNSLVEYIYAAGIAHARGLSAPDVRARTCI